MKKTNTLLQIDEFLQCHYPEISGVLLFGSASFNLKSYQDIDLILVDEKFSYVSKSALQHDGNCYSIIKIPNNELFNILAEDYKSGVFKNAFQTGFILRDDLKIITAIKQFVSKDYPDTSSIITHKINACIFKINESIKALHTKLPLVEHFITFSTCIELLIDYIILQDGKAHFATPKHKSRYLHQYHLEEATILNSIINKFNKNPKEALIKVEDLIFQLHIPQKSYHSNDYLVESMSETGCFVLFLPGLIDLNFYNYFYSLLKDLEIKFYSFFTDANNVEESGLYFIMDIEDMVTLFKIKKDLNIYLDGKSFFFPYNLSFNQEIKFGGTKNYARIKDALIKVQSLVILVKDNDTHFFNLILSLMNNIDLSLDEADLYYFYKTVNRSHHLSMADIIEKENKNKTTMKKKSIIISKRNKQNFDVDFKQLKDIPKYFLLQFFDRILSMFLLNDIEKKQIIYSLRNQSFENV